jgi:hypothetical protein
LLRAQGGEALMLLLPAERGYVELLAQRGVALQARGGGEGGRGPGARVA